MKRIVALVILPLLTACSTIQNGPMQRVYVRSIPEGAEVRAENCGRHGTKVATTPATIWVSRRATECRLEVTHADSQSRTIRLDRFASAGARAYRNATEEMCGPGVSNCNSLGDLLTMSLVGTFVFLPSLAVDLAFGSIFEQVPDRVTVTFDDHSRE